MNQSAAPMRFLIALTFEVAADRTRVWLIMRGASQREVEWTLTTFPPYPYMCPVFTELTPS